MSAGNEPVPAAVAEGWYIVCRSSDLTASPLSVTLGGTPLALFRTSSGAPGALVDRCPHRNVPLSAGTVVSDHLECEYHGWRFRTDGRCVFAAGIPDSEITEACHARCFTVREQQGFVWAYSGLEANAVSEPYRFRCLDDRSWSAGIAVLEADGTVQAVAENTLDVPHTAYLHEGLFRRRGSERTERKVEIRRYGDRAEAEYVGEPAPSGIIGAILAPKGGEVRHIDRFLLPSVTEVEYTLGGTTAFHVAVALMPIAEQRTRLFAVVGFKVPFGRHLLKLLLRPLILRIFRQDADILRKQSENIRRFGGERFVTTRADLLAPEIARLLKSARSGPVMSDSHPPVIRSTTILI